MDRSKDDSLASIAWSHVALWSVPRPAAERPVSPALARPAPVNQVNRRKVLNKSLKIRLLSRWCLPSLQSVYVVSWGVDT